MSQPVPVDTDNNDYSAELTVTFPGGNTVTHPLPVLVDVHDNAYLMTGALFQETGLITYDDGLRSTAVAESKITRIHASVKHADETTPHGVLQYRGYNVKQLATTCSFLEISYLLIYGELPDEPTFKSFSDDIKENRLLDKITEDVIDLFDRHANPMTILPAAMASLAARYEKEYDMHNEDDRYQLAIRLIAKMPTIATHLYKHQQGQRTTPPDENLGHTANFLNMLMSSTAKTADISSDHIKVLDMILTLHADHQLAVSTFVTRAVSSARTPSISSVIAGITALSGPLHGGANVKVVELLNEITEDDIPVIIEKAKSHDNPFRLPGFGHREYKGMDPRAEVLRELTHKIIKKDSDSAPLLHLALKLEEAAINDPFFKDRNLYPNIDFYSGVALTALGIDPSLFTVIFTISRVSGWLAHIEECWQTDAPLCRPKQYYTGLKERPLHWP